MARFSTSRIYFRDIGSTCPTSLPLTLTEFEPKLNDMLDTRRNLFYGGICPKNKIKKGKRSERDYLLFSFQAISVAI